MKSTILRICVDVLHIFRMISEHARDGQKGVGGGGGAKKRISQHLAAPRAAAAPRAVVVARGTSQAHAVPLM
jgi:hypothetical protein